MSDYENFVSDFPSRCLDLLRIFDRQAHVHNREVTLLLSLAMPSILIPFERLGPGAGPREKWSGHPSRDWKIYEDARRDLDELLAGQFLGSRLCPDSNPGSWAFGELSDVSGPPDTWAELRRPKALGPRVNAKTVVKHLRNALAHGNIFMRGAPDIEVIVLLSQVHGGVYKFNYLAVSPKDFRAFLANWIGFVRELRLPRAPFPEQAEAAA